jgi:hypothetical protein
MPIQNEKCRDKRAIRRLEKLRAGGGLVAVAKVRIMEAAREAGRG